MNINIMMVELETIRKRVKLTMATYFAKNEYCKNFYSILMEIEQRSEAIFREWEKNNKGSFNGFQD